MSSRNHSMPGLKPVDATLIPLFDELRGERVVLRPYTENDAADLQESVAESRDHIRPWLPFADEHQTVEQSLSWINNSRSRWILRTSMNCAVRDVKTGRFVGGIGLHVHSWNIRSFEIGYWLRKSAEGHGYITEAAQLLTDFAFDKLGANRIEIQCDERNISSANVARRLGYLQEGRLRNDFQAPDGEVRTTLVFSMIPDDRTPKAED